MVMVKKSHLQSDILLQSSTSVSFPQTMYEIIFSKATRKRHTSRDSI